MKVPVLWLSLVPNIRARGYCDQSLFEAIFSRSAWTPRDAVTFEHYEVGEDDWPEVSGAVVMIACRFHWGLEERLWELIRTRLSWSIVVFGSDEERGFNSRVFTDDPAWDKSRRAWFTSGLPGDETRGTVAPIGYWSGTHELLQRVPPGPRANDFFFAGQITHERREAVAAQLRELPNGELYETYSFGAEALPRSQYCAHLAQAKIAPCPSGPVHVDSFRIWEALEAQCLPIVDSRAPHGSSSNVDVPILDLIFGPGHGIPVVHQWDNLGDITRGLASRYPANSNAITARWHRLKKDLTCKMDEQVRELTGASMFSVDPNDLITCLITTSPVESHPSQYHIRTTVESIRAQLPGAPIVIVADGVRPEQEHLRSRYEQYLSDLLWTANFEWHNVLVVVEPEFGHQANAIRKGLEYVDSPLLFVAEHDTPIKGEIPWWNFCVTINGGTANVIRLHHEASIFPEHEFLMLDHWQQLQGDTVLKLRATRSWSQRPHLTTAAFYRDKIMPLYPESSRTFIEDKLYGYVLDDFHVRGDDAWWDWRLFIYEPDGDMQMSWHTDARGDEPKYEMSFE